MIKRIMFTLFFLASIGLGLGISAYHAATVSRPSQEARAAAPAATSPPQRETSASLSVSPVSPTPEIFPEFGSPKEPVEDRSSILQAMQILAERQRTFWKQSGWLHIVSQDYHAPVSGESSLLFSADGYETTENWFRLEDGHLWDGFSRSTDSGGAPLQETVTLRDGVNVNLTLWEAGSKAEAVTPPDAEWPIEMLPDSGVVEEYTSLLQDAGRSFHIRMWEENNSLTVELRYPLEMPAEDFQQMSGYKGEGAPQSATLRWKFRLENGSLEASETHYTLLLPDGSQETWIAYQETIVSCEILPNLPPEASAALKALQQKANEARDAVNQEYIP